MFDYNSKAIIVLCKAYNSYLQLLQGVFGRNEQDIAIKSCFTVRSRKQ